MKLTHHEVALGEPTERWSTGKLKKKSHDSQGEELCAGQSWTRCFLLTYVVCLSVTNPHKLKVSPGQHRDYDPKTPEPEHTYH